VSRRGTTAEESVKIKRTRYLSLEERIIIWATPWVLGFLTLPLGLLIHWQASSPVMAIVITACSGTLTWVTYKTWGRRHEYTRNAATVISGGLTGWLAVCTALNPATRPMTTAWVVLWVMLSLIWNIRHGSISSDNKHDQPSSKAETAWEPIKRLKGSRTHKVRETKDGAVAITIQHPGGKATTADVLGSREKIASRFAVDTSAVSVSGVPGRADQSVVTVRPDNPTGHAVLWPGLSAPGRSIADSPVRIGVRADGSPLVFWVSGDDEVSRPLPHTLWTGMTGSGKTESYCTAVLEMRSRTDCVPVVADPVKFMINFGDMADAFALAADGPDQTAQMIRNLPDTLVYRAWLLGKLGYKQWVPECYTRHGIPLVHFHIEEAASVLATNGKFNEAIRTARALGFSVSASMQVAVFRNLPREARSQFGNSLAHGVREMQDAKFALTDATLAAGADPTQWGANHPGRMYAEVVGVPDEQWPMECRAYRVTASEKRAALDMTRPHWAKLDPGTAMRLGKGIDVPDATRMDSVPADLALVPEPPDDTWGYPEYEEDEAPTVDFGKPDLAVVNGDRPSTESARQMVLDRISDLESRGQETVVFNDFSDMIRGTGRTRSWLYFELDRHTGSGRLDRIPGPERRYRILRMARP
jgi:hypothetical protein